MKAEQALKLVRFTEKTNVLSAELGQYTFEVDVNATKHDIVAAVEKAFKVTVKRVNTLQCKGKSKRSRVGRPGKTSDFKKAVVTLKAGDKIEIV